MRLRQISWLPVIIMMLVIYFFSSKPAVNSGEDSMIIANGILDIYEDIADVQFEEAARIESLGFVDHVVRKAAHFTEYAILAGTLILHFYIRNKKRKKLILYPIILSAMYAATDEFHQLFVPGRSCEIKDVLLDTAGAATGALLCYFILRLLKRKGKSKLDAAIE